MVAIRHAEGGFSFGGVLRQQHTPTVCRRHSLRGYPRTQSMCSKGCALLACIENNLLPPKTTSPSSLTAHNIPVRINPGPSLSGIGSRRFALVVGRKPQDSIARGERARACAVGAFHQLDAALQKTFCLDRDLARKGAFECFHRFHLISYQIASCSTLNPCFASRDTVPCILLSLWNVSLL